MSEIRYSCEVRFCHYPYGGISHLPSFEIERGEREFSDRNALVQKIKSELAGELFKANQDYACHIEYRVIGSVPYANVDIEAKSKWHEIDGRVDASEPKKD